MSYLTSLPAQGFVRLRSFNLPSLLYRRHRMDMIMVYKMTQGISGCPFKKFFIIKSCMSIQEAMDLKSTSITFTLMSGNILSSKRDQ